MVLDVNRARRDTPACRDLIHLNNAGAALMPIPVVDAVKDHLDLEAREGGYEAQAKEAERIDGVYRSVAKLINAGPDEIALVENATRAWDMAFYALAKTFQPGDRLLTANAEYASNFIAILQTALATGVSVELVPDDGHGRVSIESLRATLDDRVRLVALTHVPTNGGLVNPAAEVGRLCRANGIPFLLDACQSAGQIPLDVEELGCDMLSATGRKYLRGPRGTGFLYVRRDMIQRLEPPFLDLHAATWAATNRYEIRPDAKRFETWESNVAAKIGLGAAVDYALGWGMEDVRDRIQGLATGLRERLSTIRGLTVRDKGVEKCGIVTFTVDGWPAETIKVRLAEHRVNLSVSPLNFARIDLEARGLGDLVRASVHYYNTEEELDETVRILSNLVRMG